jgi:hypothetical protein
VDSYTEELVYISRPKVDVAAQVSGYMTTFLTFLAFGLKCTTKPYPLVVEVLTMAPF